VAKYLIDCGEKPDAQMMITAIKDYGATDTVKFLLDNGVDPNSRDEKDTTAIELAVRHEHTNIVRLLVDHKAKVGVPWVSANKLLISGCINGQSQIVKMMLACGADPNARGMDGNSAAELAAQCEHPRVLRVLMDAGAKATTPELEKIFAELKAKPAK
jgi:ankyrin repeat protein